MMTGVPVGAMFGVPTAFGFIVPFGVTAFGLIVPFGVTWFGATVFGVTGVPVLTPLLTPLAPGVFEPALFGMTPVVLFIERAWLMHAVRRFGSKLWQLVPDG
jgi:hypothetical protein